MCEAGDMTWQLDTLQTTMSTKTEGGHHEGQCLDPRTGEEQSKRREERVVEIRAPGLVGEREGRRRTLGRILGLRTLREEF